MSQQEENHYFINLVCKKKWSSITRVDKVMSPPSVPSEETKELLADFYTLLSKGETKAVDLREGRQNLVKK